METKTVSSTGLVQTPTKGQLPHNTAHLINKDINPIASVFGGDLKTKCFDNQGLWWEEHISSYMCCDMEARCSVKAPVFCYM